MTNYDATELLKEMKRATERNVKLPISGLYYIPELSSSQQLNNFQIFDAQNRRCLCNQNFTHGKNNRCFFLTDWNTGILEYH